MARDKRPRSPTNAEGPALNSQDAEKPPETPNDLPDTVDDVPGEADPNHSRRPDVMPGDAPSGSRPLNESQGNESQGNESQGTGDDSAFTFVAPVTSAERSTRLTSLEALPALFGDYELLDEIARGGMGITYRARQIRLNRIVALKMIKSGQLANEQEIRRFQTEAELAAGLDHPNIVPVFEVGEIDGHHFFSMGYVDGESLEQRLLAGPMPLRDSARLLMIVAQAIHYAHEKGVIHRDLKPGNIMLANSPVRSGPESVGAASPEAARQLEDSSADLEVLVPRVTDFGLAKQLADDSDLTVAGQVLGTPGYMPPEQADGRVGDIGPHSDVYSLGAILYCLLTGRPPFQAAGMMKTLRQVVECEPASPRQLNWAIDQDLETICLKCLEKEPKRRYRSALAVADELRRYLDHRPIRARSIGRLAHFARWCRRRPALATLSVTLVIALLAGTMVSTYYAVQANHNAKIFRWEKIHAAHETDLAQAALRNEQQAHAKLKASLAETEQTIRKWVEMASNAELLREPRFKPLLKELLDDALLHYEYFVKEHDSDQDALTRIRLADAFFEIGKINDRSGDTSQAIVAYRQAINQYQRLTSDQRDDASFPRALAKCYCNVGLLLCESGTADEAREALQQAARLFEELVERSPARSGDWSDLATTWEGCGTLFAENGDLAKGLDYRERALRIRIRQQRDDPNNHGLASSLANSYHGVALSRFDLGQNENTVSLLRKSEAILTRLLNDNPENSRDLSDLADVRNTLGTLLWQTGDYLASIAVFQNRRDTYEQLVKYYPTVSHYRYNLAGSYFNMAGVYKRIGRRNETMAAYQKARTLFEGLATEDPSFPGYRSSLASVYFNEGNYFTGTHQSAKAIAAFEQALTLQRQLAADSPSRTEYWSDLARTLNGVGAVYDAENDRARAREAYRDAVVIRERLVRENPDMVWYAIHLAGSYVNVSTLCDAASKETGVDDLNHAIELLQNVLARDAHHAVARRYLRNAFWMRAKTNDRLAQYRAAAADWQQASRLTSGWLRTNFVTRQIYSLSGARDPEFLPTAARAIGHECVTWLLAIVTQPKAKRATHQ